MQTPHAYSLLGIFSTNCSISQRLTMR